MASNAGQDIHARLAASAMLRALALAPKRTSILFSLPLEISFFFFSFSAGKGWGGSPEG